MSEVKVSRTNVPARASAPLFEMPAWGLSSPFSLMRRLTGELEDMFGNGGMHTLPSDGATWAPTIEVEQAGGPFKVRAELPGMKKDDIKVEAAEGGLIIEGERREEHEDKKEGYYRSERSYGKFYRMLPLPDGAQIDKAKADYANGVLEVAVPVPEPKKPEKRQIPVQAKSA